MLKFVYLGCEFWLDVYEFLCTKDLCIFCTNRVYRETYSFASNRLQLNNFMEIFFFRFDYRITRTVIDLNCNVSTFFFSRQMFLLSFRMITVGKWYRQSPKSMRFIMMKSVNVLAHKNFFSGIQTTANTVYG